MGKHKIGKSPGSPIFNGEAKMENVVMHLIAFDADSIEEIEISALNELETHRKDNKIIWLDVIGLHDADQILKIAKHFSIHDLSVEDILNTKHRVKTQVNDDYILSILKMVMPIDKAFEIEQISLVLMDGVVISFQERAGDVFESVRKRLRGQASRMRNRKSDYLFYALLDIVVDHYFLVLDRLGDRLEKMESRMEKTDLAIVNREVGQTRKQLIRLRKALMPAREAVLTLRRSENTLIEESTQKYLEDVYDHTVQIVEQLESYRDLNSSIKDLAISEISFQMNKVMQVLTIVSTIFIPITFIAGIYGMNFEYIPELKFKYGYFVAWGIMVIMILMMLWFFKRRKWF